MTSHSEENRPSAEDRRRKFAKKFLINWTMNPSDEAVEVYAEAFGSAGERFARSLVSKSIGQLVRKYGRDKFAPSPETILAEITALEAGENQALQQHVTLPPELEQFWSAVRCGCKISCIMPRDQDTRDSIWRQAQDGFGSFRPSDNRIQRWPAGYEPTDRDNEELRWTEQEHEVRTCMRIMGRAMLEYGPMGAEQRFRGLSEDLYRVGKWVGPILNEITKTRGGDA